MSTNPEISLPPILVCQFMRYSVLISVLCCLVGIPEDDSEDSGPAAAEEPAPNEPDVDSATSARATKGAGPVMKHAAKWAMRDQVSRPAITLLG
jgi:hypothetical protein